MAVKFGENLYGLSLNALRIVTGFLFQTHGGAKLFAWYGAESPRTDPLEYLIAGILEFFGGIAIALGLGTRYVAFVLCGETAVVFWWKHVAARGELWPWSNRGELPALFCFVFLFLWASGGGNWTLEHLLRGRFGKRQSS